LRMFQRQVLLQCKFVQMAAAQLNDSLRERNSEATFYALQNLLNAAANISKVLWGQSGRLTSERKAVRDSIGIQDDSPFQTVTMRNNYEHFDDRIDTWWQQSKRHNAADCNIMPRAEIRGIDDIDRFRAFDPVTNDLSFWGQDFNVQELIDEVQRIFPKLKEEASKPHWVT